MFLPQFLYSLLFNRYNLRQPVFEGLNFFPLEKRLARWRCEGKASAYRSGVATSAKGRTRSRKRSRGDSLPHCICVANNKKFVAVWPFCRNQAESNTKLRTSKAITRMVGNHGRLALLAFRENANRTNRFTSIKLPTRDKKASGSIIRTL